MANASRLISPSVPRSRQRTLPSFRYSRSGSFPLNRNTKRLLLCSAVEGAGQRASRVSPSESRVPRFVIQGCKLVGCGSAVPNRIISNDDIAKIVETSAKWISERTGICNRRVLSGEETLTGLSVEAAKKALQMAQVDPNDLDLILLCTSTPDDRFGSAPQIQKALCPKRYVPAYDIKAACSGFVLGLDSAACYIRGGRKNVLVVGADALSRCVDWTDRATCILFGDGAGAVLVQACDVEEKGLFGFDLHTDGNGGRHLNARVKDDETEHASGSIASVLGFPPRRAFYSYIQMNGSEVFRFAVERVPPSIESALQNSGLAVSDIDFLLLHQANQRIIDAVATRLGVPPELVISNLHDYGNTGAASIALALDQAVRAGRCSQATSLLLQGLELG